LPSIDKFLLLDAILVVQQAKDSLQFKKLLLSSSFSSSSFKQKMGQQQRQEEAE